MKKNSMLLAVLVTFCTCFEVRPFGPEMFDAMMKGVFGITSIITAAGAGALYGISKIGSIFYTKRKLQLLELECVGDPATIENRSTTEDRSKYIKTTAPKKTALRKILIDCVNNRGKTLKNWNDCNDLIKQIQQKQNTESTSR